MKELKKILEEIDEEMTEKEAIQTLKLEGGLEITGKAKRVADFFAGLETAITALKEIQQYREIGTVEECREAVEKQKAKKIVYESESVFSNGFSHYRMGKCPMCNKYYNSNDEVKYCPKCGQAIKWENLEEMEDD